MMSSASLSTGLVPTVTVAIDGFGAVGRAAVREIHLQNRIEGASPQFVVTAIRDGYDVHMASQLLRFESGRGHFPGKVTTKGDAALVVDGTMIPFIQASRDPEAKREELKADILLDCTGKCDSRERGLDHLEHGARKVIVANPLESADLTVAIGVNEGLYDPANHHLLSIASGTTQCLAVLGIHLHENFGIETGFASAIHSVTPDQGLLDQPHPNLRMARAAMLSIIPTPASANDQMGWVLPAMRGKLFCCAFHVPIHHGSVMDLTVQLQKDPSPERINELFHLLSQDARWGRIIGYSVPYGAGEDESPLESIVSSMVLDSPLSAYVDGEFTKVLGGRFLKVLAWFDNARCFSRATVDLMLLLASDF